MQHELDDDTVRLLQPVHAGEVEIDEDFEREFAALVPASAAAVHETAAQVRTFESCGHDPAMPCNGSQKANTSEQLKWPEQGPWRCMFALLTAQVAASA